MGDLHDVRDLVKTRSATTAPSPERRAGTPYARPSARTAPRGPTRMRGPAPTICASRIEVSDIARWNSSITVASLNAPATASSMLNIDMARQPIVARGHQALLVREAGAAEVSEAARASTCREAARCSRRRALPVRPRARRSAPPCRKGSRWRCRTRATTGREAPPFSRASPGRIVAGSLIVMLIAIKFSFVTHRGPARGAPAVPPAPTTNRRRRCGPSPGPRSGRCAPGPAGNFGRRPATRCRCRAAAR